MLRKSQTKSNELDKMNSIETEQTFLIDLLRRPVEKRKSSELKVLIDFTKKMPFFEDYQTSNVRKKVHKEICLNMQLESFKQGQPIIHFGDQPEKFYIILKGGCSVFLPKDEGSLKNQISEVQSPLQSPTRKGLERKTEWGQLKYSEVNWDEGESDEVMIGGIPESKLEHKDPKLFDENSGVFKFVFGGILPSGTSFGEIGLIKRQTRGATVIANEETYLGVITRAVFDKTIKHGENLKLQKKIDFFMDVFFHSCTRDTAMRICLYFKPIQMTKDQFLFKENEATENVYFLKKGLLSFWKKVDINQVDFQGEEEENGMVDPNKSKIIQMEARKLYNWPNPSQVKAECLFTKGPKEIVGDLEAVLSQDSQYSVKVLSLKFKAFAITKANFTHIFNFYPSIHAFFSARLPLVEKKKRLEEKTIRIKKKQVETKNASLISAEMFLKSKRRFGRSQQRLELGKIRESNGMWDTQKKNCLIALKEGEKPRNISDINGLHKIENITESNQKKLSVINQSIELPKEQSFAEVFAGSINSGRNHFVNNIRIRQSSFCLSSKLNRSSVFIDSQSRSPTISQIKQKVQHRKNKMILNLALITNNQPSQQLLLTNPSSFSFSLKAKFHNNTSRQLEDPQVSMRSKKASERSNMQISSFHQRSKSLNQIKAIKANNDIKSTKDINP